MWEHCFSVLEQVEKTFHFGVIFFVLYLKYVSQRFRDIFLLVDVYSTNSVETDVIMGYYWNIINMIIWSNQRANCFGENKNLLWLVIKGHMYLIIFIK